MSGKLGEIRCSSCGKLLGMGNLKDAILELKCKCKALNVIEVTPPPVTKVPFQERMDLVKKDDSLSFTIKRLPE